MRREDRAGGRDAPARRPAPSAAKPRPRATREASAFGALAPAGRLARACLRRPGPLVAALVLVGATAAVSMNALRQTGRHPAPLFGEARPAPARPRVAAAPAATAALPAAAPQPSPVTSAPQGASAPQVASTSQGARRDPIGDLIRGDAVTTASTGAKADPDVRLAQRALAKLGYGSLKADGLMGAETRAALERFERERKLPATGQAGGRTLRALAQASGLSSAPVPHFPSTGDGVVNPKTID